MYIFKERALSVFSMDKLRILKIIEIAQYSFIFLFLICIATFLLNKFYFDRKHKKKKPDYTHIFKLSVRAYLEIFIMTLVLFYIRKIGLIIPSISTFFDSKFKPHTTLEYSVHIAIVVAFVEFMPKIKHNIGDLMDALLEI